MHVSRPSFHPNTHNLVLKYHFIGKLPAERDDFRTRLSEAKLFGCRMI